ncbi:uncharacterized protein LOC125449409 [Stegostoma tigrinum]|uniref:uncharacterized protein LOC125449409 n=1 Tax=Stegostoma tigrinum TaxID=3053191 RepID=UPI00202B5524|nr:uncharacterized protein LOC125449409 [Stegostoma tigrinum]
MKDSNQFKIVYHSLFTLLYLAVCGSGFNYFTTLCANYARQKGQTNCWVCATIPHHGESGIPLTILPMTREEVGQVLQFNTSVSDTWESGGGTWNSSYGNWWPCWGRWKGSKGNYSFKGWFPRPAPWTRGAIDGLRVTPPRGQVNSTCFCNWNVSAPFQLGNSSCKVYQVAHEYSLPIPLNGTYWVCDTRAYPYLPGEQHEHQGAQGSGIEWTLPPEQKGWSGCCYLAYLVPHVHIPKQVPWTRKEWGKKRCKPRKVTETDRLFWTLLLPYGTARAGLAASLEELANGTATALSEPQTQVWALTTEMIALRLVALQN